MITVVNDRDLKKEIRKLDQLNMANFKWKHFNEPMHAFWITLEEYDATAKKTVALFNFLSSALWQQS